MSSFLLATLSTLLLVSWHATGQDFSGCPINVDITVPKAESSLRGIMEDSSMYPMKLVLAQESGNARVFSCYTMDSAFKMAYWTSNGIQKLDFNIVQTMYTNETVKLQYQPFFENVLGINGYDQALQMTLVSITQDFLFFRVCTPKGNQRDNLYVFAKNTVNLGAIDWTLLIDVVRQNYGPTTVRKGVCS